MRSLVFLGLFSTAPVFAPPLGFTAILDFASGVTSSTSIIRYEGQGWRHLGDIPQRYNASTATNQVFVGTRHGSNASTDFWNFHTSATPVLIRSEAKSYDALGPFSSQEVLAYSHANGLQLLSPQGTWDLASASDLLQPLYDVTLARGGPDTVLLYGTPDSSLALPGTLLPYRLVVVQLLGQGHGVVAYQADIPDAISGRPPLLWSGGAVFAEADRATAGQRLSHVPTKINGRRWTEVQQVHSPNLHDRLVPLAVAGTAAPFTFYFRDGKALGHQRWAAGHRPSVLDANFFDPASIGNVPRGGLQNMASSYVGIAAYIPPAEYPAWQSWGQWTASIMSGVLSMGSSISPAGAFTTFIGTSLSGNLSLFSPATTLPTSMPAPVSSNPVPLGPSISERLETLWKRAHEKKILRTDTPTAQFAAGDLVQILAQMQIDSEWLDLALRQLGPTKYEPLGLSYRSGWSAPSYGKQIVFAELVTLLGEAKSCGGLLDEK